MGVYGCPKYVKIHTYRSLGWKIVQLATYNRFFDISLKLILLIYLIQSRKYWSTSYPAQPTPLILVRLPPYLVNKNSPTCKFKINKNRKMNLLCFLAIRLRLFKNFLNSQAIIVKEFKLMDNRLVKAMQSKFVFTFYV